MQSYVRHEQRFVLNASDSNDHQSRVLILPIVMQIKPIKELNAPRTQTSEFEILIDYLSKMYHTVAREPI